MKRIFEKAERIGAVRTPEPSAEATTVERSAEPKARTAPGTMMGFLTAQSSAVQEAETLRSRMRELEGTAPLRRLDPRVIALSKWSNRHQASFGTQEFAQLKEEIAAAGGNVQPIKVRPAKVLNGSTEEGGRFEIVYGHRRHRACLELGLDVLATVEEMSDTALFEQMERENRGRKNLSAWEQGMMYRRALDDGLYVSLRKLAEGVGIDVSLASKSVTLARLPEEVINAFASPLEIQFRWATPLSEAMQKDPDGTLKRARELAGVQERPSAVDVYRRLCGGSLVDDRAQGAIAIAKGERKVGSLEFDRKGGAVLRLEKGELGQGRAHALAKLVEQFLLKEK